MNRRAAFVIGAAVAIAVVLFMKCRGIHGHARPASVKTTAGAAAGARGPRDAKPDPRTLARVAIHGVVTAKGGGPIAGAQVCMMAALAHVPDDETRDPKCIATDAKGAYGFDQLYAGTYWVSASAPTYIPASWHGPAPDRRGEIKLDAGQRRDDIDIALKPGGVEVRGTVSDINGGPIAEAWVRVAPNSWSARSNAATTRTAADGTFSTWAAPGAISGSASADGYADGSADGVAPTQHLEILLTPESVLAGVVVTAESGTPVPDADVTIERTYRWMNGDGGDSGGSGHARTDAQGRFRITRLPPGRYKPVATSLGRYGEPADSVLLGLGQTVDNVTIPVHAVRVVTGRIVVADGAGPAKGCDHGWISLVNKGDRRVSAATELDGSGDVRIDAITPGSYQVMVQCEGYVSDDTYPKLEIADKDVTGVEWKVTTGATIAGTVRTKAGAPVADANVYAHTTGGDPRGQRSMEGDTTEDDGTFHVRGLSPGEYAIELSADKFPSPRDPVKATAAVGKEAHVDIVLDDGGAIAGVVADEHGKPVANARVRAQGERWDWGGGGERTADDGTFTISGVAAGSYRVTASRSWWDAMRKPGSTDDDVQGERTTVSAGETAHVRLVVESQTGTIAGVVVEATGAPVADAYLAAERESDAAGAYAGAAARQSHWGWDRKPVVTDASGAFKLTSLSPGTYTVRAYRKGGGEAISEHVALGTTKARLVMKPTASLAGTVTLVGGGTPDELSVSASDRTAGFSRSERYFRTGGVFTLADLPAGQFVVRASAPEGVVETTIALAEGEHKTGVTLQLEARVTVKGRLVTLDDGKPAPGLQVMVAPLKQGGDAVILMGGGETKQNISDADGRFTVEDAPAGRVRIQAWPIDWENSEYSFVGVPRTLTGGGEIDIGELKVPRRRTGPRDKGSDLGFDLKEWGPTVEPEDATLEISRIRPDGPAVHSGLVVGDVVVSVDGTDVKGENSYLAWSLWQVPVGTVVKLGLARGATVSITSVPEP